MILQKIKNPNYKGKWKAPLIDNPGKPLHIFLVLLTHSMFSAYYNLRGPE